MNFILEKIFTVAAMFGMISGFSIAALLLRGN
jgi:hypothetical protein